MKKALMLLLSLFITGCANTNPYLGATSAASGNDKAVSFVVLSRNLVGSHIGKSMTDGDRVQFNNILENNAVGQTAYWHNQTTGIDYDVVPVQNVIFYKNPYCREFRSSVILQNKLQHFDGVACRTPDGSWQIVNSN